MLKISHKIRRAFTIIELLIYLSIFSVFVILSFSFLVSIQKTILKESSKNEKFIRNSIALDLLQRDLCQADSYINNWDIQSFVFVKEVLRQDKRKTCIGWRVEKGGLKRIEGIYNFASKKWGKRIVSTVTNYLVCFDFKIKTCKDTGLVSLVIVKIDNRERIINLRNKIV